MAQFEVRLYNVANPGDLSVGFSGLAFVRIDLFDRLSGMSAINGAVGEVICIVNRRRSHGNGKDKAVIGVQETSSFKP